MGEGTTTLLREITKKIERLEPKKQTFNVPLEASRGVATSKRYKLPISRKSLVFMFPISSFYVTFTEAMIEIN